MEWPEPLFPKCFPRLHSLLKPLMEWTKDRAVLHMKACFSEVLHAISGGTGAGNGGKYTADTVEPSGAVAFAEQQRLMRRGGPLSEALTTCSGGAGGVGPPPPSASDAAAAVLDGAVTPHEGHAAQAAHTGAIARSEEGADEGGEAVALSRGLAAAAATAHEVSTGDEVDSGSTCASWKHEGTAFVRQAEREGIMAAALGLIACVLCGLLRGAVTQEGRWAAVSLLLKVCACFSVPVQNACCLSQAHRCPCHLLFVPRSGDAARSSAAMATGLHMQIGLFCDDHCRLEWIIPYLLQYVIPDKPAQQGRAAASPSSIDDTVPRTIVLSQLPQIIAQLSELPRSERSLFNSYIMPMLAALPDRHASVLRAQSAQSLAVIAQAASALQESAVRAAMVEGTVLFPFCSSSPLHNPHFLTEEVRLSSSCSRWQSPLPYTQCSLAC
jgi:hypothetical protein